MPREHILTCMQTNIYCFFDSLENEIYLKCFSLNVLVFSMKLGDIKCQHTKEFGGTWSYNTITVNSGENGLSEYTLQYNMYLFPTHSL